MRAITYSAYGSADELRLNEVACPGPGDDEVLVEVHATSLNSWDVDLLHGQPFLARIDSPSKPKYATLGADVAGVVVAAGKSVTRFKVGDAVFGDLSVAHWGGLAEYVSAKADALAVKPDGLSFEVAAAMPQAGLLALQALRYGHPVAAGDDVVVNGGGGGVGTFAIKLAKSFGATVTAVDHSAKLQTMLEAGADQVLDYTRDDFSRNGVLYDRIVDVVSKRSISEYRRALAPNGCAVVIGGQTGKILQAAVFGGLSGAFGGRRRVGLLIYRGGGDAVAELAEVCARTGITPVIGRTYALEDAADAFRDLGEGRVLGKAVVLVRSGPDR